MHDHPGQVQDRSRKTTRSPAARAAATAVALVLAIGTGTATARADDLGPFGEPEHLDVGGPRPLNVNLKVDGAITLGEILLWSGLGFEKGSLAPTYCRWCNPGGLDASARRAVLWAEPSTAAKISSVLVWSVPAGVAAYDVLAAHRAGDTSAAVTDFLVMTQAVAANGILTQLVKYASGRERPYAAGAPLSNHNSNATASFWSGHTATAFSAAAAGGMVAQLRGYSGWPWVYGVGFTAAGAVGYFRMAADKHWLSDVLAGAASGAAIGLAIPWLHRGTSPDRPHLVIEPQGVGVTGHF